MNSDIRRAPETDEIDLTRLWGMLLDNRWLIVGVTLATFFLSVLYAVLATPVYRADALLQVEDKQGGVPGFAELSEMFVQESSATAEIEIIRSRMVLNDVIDQLRLDIQVEPDRLPFFGACCRDGPPVIDLPTFAGYSDSSVGIAVSELDVPDTLFGQPLSLVADGQQQYRVLHGGDVLLSARVGDSAVGMNGRLRIKVGALVAESGDAFNITKAGRLAVIKSLQDNLSVAEQGKNTGMLRVTYTGTSPAKITATLNAVSESYLLQNIKRLSAEAENSLEFLNRQLPEMKSSLEQAEEKLNQYRLQSESVDLSLETASVLERIVELESKLNELSFKESEISRLFTTEHPSYQTLRQQRARLLEERDQLNEQIKALPETQQEILRLTRDVQVSQEIYVQMLNKVQELRILKAGTVGNVRIIDTAVADPTPVKPKKPLIVALGIVLGGMLAVGWVLLRAAFHRGIESPEQLEQEGIVVYATVPKSETQMKPVGRLPRRKTQRAVSLLALENPADLAIEAMRSLRTSLHFAMLDASNPVLMICGPSAGVGKSFISANLAAVLAQINKKVLLVDADMRRGHLHGYFREGRDNGLSEYLSGQRTLDDVITPTQLENLWFMSAGAVPPNPAELLMQRGWSELIRQASERYDLVIVDTPPVLAVTDPGIVGQYADTALMVTRFDTNSVKEVQAAIERLERSGVKVKGAILNCMEARAGSGYGYYGYSYYSSDSNDSKGNKA
ncbi:MAG: polysaccharide biosynthesis tyrosine autokinase [Alcanivoracaceae bacterium]|nr:polysaccharide biosynthesis tyrosine autokinase [Alcanivoracaceae bacterium]